MSAITWHIWIDWNQDGIYEDDEGGRFCGFGGPLERGRDEFMGDPIAGTADIQLRNDDGAFNPWNTQSPLYALIADNARIKIQCDHDGTTYTLLTGNIEDIRVSGVKAAGVNGGDRIAHIIARDAWQALSEQTVGVALQQNITTTDAINAILTAVGWDNNIAGIFTLDISVLDGPDVLGGIYAYGTDLGDDPGDTIPYWWVEANETVMQAILDLVNSVFGWVHIGSDGTLVVRTLADDNGAAIDTVLTDDVIQEIVPTLLRQQMYNSISIHSTPRIVAALGSIWQLTEVPFIAAGDTAVFTAQWTAALNVITPTIATDYTANSLPNGTGVDCSALLTVTISTTGSGATVTVVNGAGTGVYLTLLQVRGQLVQQADATAMLAQDDIGIQRRRVRLLERTLRWQQNSEIAQSWANWAASYFATPRFALEVHFEHSNTGLAGELGQKILDSTVNGTGAKYRIGKITHEVGDPAGQELHTTWLLFPILPDNYFLLDSSIIGDTNAPLAPP